MGPFHHFPDSQGLTSNPSQSRKAFHLNLYWEIYSLIKLSSPEIHFAVFHWYVILNRCHLKACPIFLWATLQSTEVKSKLECFHVDNQRRHFPTLWFCITHSHVLVKVSFVAQHICLPLIIRLIITHDQWLCPYEKKKKKKQHSHDLINKSFFSS